MSTRSKSTRRPLVEPNSTMRLTTAIKDKVIPIKEKVALSIKPEIGEDNSTSLKSHFRGESSNRTPKDSLSNTDRPTEPIEEIKPKLAPAPK